MRQKVVFGTVIRNDSGDEISAPALSLKLPTLDCVHRKPAASCCRRPSLRARPCCVWVPLNLLGPPTLGSRILKLSITPNH